MMRSLLSTPSFVLICLVAAPLGAEVQVDWERNETAAANDQFQFRKIPAPSKSDAATNARISIAAGRDDHHSGNVDALVDGQMPGNADQPDANFFFEPGTAAGRIVVDLGQATPVRQMNTYSWHTGARGPQVYRLYASNVAGDVPPPALKDTDLKQAGWRLVASVDTRPREGELGGQYGVSISAKEGEDLGTYRYLLLDVTRTTEKDQYDQTFFSEIDIVDGRQHVAAQHDPAKVDLVFDTTDVPELKPWVDEKLRPVCRQWYPKIVQMLPSEGYRAPQRVVLAFHRDLPVVAATVGSRVHCSGPWFRQNLDGEAVGAVVHELVHVVQSYKPVRGGNSNPGWLVEGLADYIRWFLYEPEALRPRPDPARANYTDSYRTTAAFLDHVGRTHDKDIVKKLNAAMRTGRYSEGIWTQHTGKSPDELWTEYVKALNRK